LIFLFLVRAEPSAGLEAEGAETTSIRWVRGSAEVAIGNLARMSAHSLALHRGLASARSVATVVGVESSGTGNLSRSTTA
jgi:hypothetical protein